MFPVTRGAGCVSLSLLLFHAAAFLLAGEHFLARQPAATLGYSLLLIIGISLMQRQLVETPLKWLASVLALLYGTVLLLDVALLEALGGGIPWASLHQLDEWSHLQDSATSLLTPAVTVLFLFLVGSLAFCYWRRPSAQSPQWSIPAAGPLVLLAIVLWGSLSPLEHPVARGFWSLRGDQSLGDGPLIPTAAPENELLHGEYVESPKETAALRDAAMQMTQARQNVVLIVLESVSAIDMLDGDAVNAERTPTLHRLLQSGVLFSDIYSPFPSSDVANVTITTGGLAPTLSNSRDLWDASYAGPSLPQQFKQAGYHTALVATSGLNYRNIGSFFRQLPYDQVIDFSALEAEDQEKVRLNSWGGDDRVFVDKALEWIGDGGQSEPFFLQLGTNAPHHPYTVPDDVTDSLAGDNRYDRFRRALAFVDRALGRLLDTLEQRQLLHETVIAITGDHGDPVTRSQAVGYRQRGDLDETTVRSFLLLSAPERLDRPVVSTRVGDHGDIAATLSALVGERYPLATSNNLLDPNYEPRLIFFHFSEPPSVGLRDGQWKYRYRPGQSERLLRLQDGVETVVDTPDAAQLRDYRERVLGWYFERDRRFLAHLEGAESALGKQLPESAWESPGLKLLKSGYIALEQGSQRFHARDRFHPQERVMVWSYWVSGDDQRPLRYRWQSPSGRVLEREFVLLPEAERLRFFLNDEAPLESGTWSFSVIDGGRTLMQTQFVVNADVTVADSLASQLGPVIDLAVFAINGDGIRATTVGTEDDLVVSLEWLREHRHRTYQLILIDPEGRALTFPLSVAPFQGEDEVMLTPPDGLLPGGWQAHVVDGDISIANAGFTVIAEDAAQ